MFANSIPSNVIHLNAWKAQVQGKGLNRQLLDLDLRPSSSVAACRDLLARGAHPDAQDEQGMTLLMRAVRGCVRFRQVALDIADALLAAGADVSVTDKNGRTALDYLPEGWSESRMSFVELMRERLCR